MRTETTTQTTVVKHPWKVSIQGNVNEAPVKALNSPDMPGDGNINTGHGGNVYASLKARCGKSGSYAVLYFTYTVQNDNYEKAMSADCLQIVTNRVFDLKDYDYIAEPWSYVNEKGERVTVEERISWTLGNAPEAIYIDYYKAKNKRHGFYKVDNSFPQINREQAWIPRESLRFKIDDEGSELTKAGNLAFTAEGYIPVRVKRTITKTYDNLLDKTEKAILARDNALAKPTLDAILNNRPITTLEDGTRNFANMAITDSGSTGAWLRGTRQEQLGIISYTFPHNTTTMVPSSDYYLGAIVLVDNQFRTHQPTKVVFSDSERKPLSMYATNSRINLPFDNVLPTAKEMNNKKNAFLERYLTKVTDKTQLPSMTTIDYEDFESVDGISIGGSIKGVDFGFSSGECKKRVRVYSFKQVLFSLALDDTYKRGSEFFSDKLNLPEFRAAMKHYSPAIISTVHYGKVAYLAIASEDKSAMSVNISKSDFLSGKATMSGASKKCTFKAIVLGGTVGTMNGTMDFSNLKEADNFLTSICREMTAMDAEAALPIEFEAKYLCNPAQKVTTNVYKYFTKYVDKIKIHVREDNKGATISARLRLLDYDYDAKGQRDYVYRYWNQGLDYTKEISPWACCIELKFDVLGSEDIDFNVFIPYIPLSALRQESNGDWVFRVKIGGTTCTNAKNNVTVDPTLPGCYINSNNKYFRGALDEKSYKGKSEEYVLTEFFNYCEEMRVKHSSFARLTNNKRIKSCRGND